MFTPDRLIDASGNPHFGVFADAVPEINVADHRPLTPLEKPAGRVARRFGHKQFEYLGVMSEDLIFGCAMAHIGYATVAFLYVYRPATTSMWEKTLRLPLDIGVHQSRSPVYGRSTFRSGSDLIEFGYADNPRRKSLKVRLADGFRADISIDESAAGFRPMSLCTQAGRRGWVYAHKVAGVPAEGMISGPAGDFDLAAIGACGHHDFSSGYMRRETFWNWACLSGRDDGGRLLGLNISSGVNETGFSENCAWLDGELFPLDQARFTYDWDEPMRPWHVRTAGDAVDLRFEPEGSHLERFDLVVVKSNFKQLFGRFNGTVRYGEDTVAITDLYGFVEDQYAKW